MENITEELVRQNGNQAAAVMADYAGQGGGGGGSTSSATTVLPKELDWTLNDAKAIYSGWPKSGDIVLVPYYPQRDGVKRLYQVLIEDIVPLDEIPEEPSEDFSFGIASLLGSFLGGGNPASAASMPINGGTPGWCLGIELGELQGEFELSLYANEG